MAALNFPDPNVTTSYTNPDTGITYEWANGIWKAVRTAQTAPELFVDADGDNLTGNLTLGTDKIVLNATDGSATFADIASSGAFHITDSKFLSETDELIRIIKNGERRFVVRQDGSGEFAGNASVGGVVVADYGFQSNAYSGRSVGITTTTQGVERALAVEDGSGGYSASLNMDGSAYFASNVGIGTASPIEFGPSLHVAGTDPAFILQDTATAVDYFGINIASGVVANWFDDAAAWAIGTASGIAGTAFSEKMRIDSAGNVGIGLISPSSKAHVKGGSLTVEHSSPQTGTGQFNINSENNSQVSLSYDDQGHISIGTASTPWNQGGFSEKVRINSAGNVGIGTSSPDQQLTIKRSGGQTQVSLISDTTQSGAIYFGDTASTSRGVVRYDHNGDFFRFYTAGVERMRIDSYGITSVLSSNQGFNSRVSTGPVDNQEIFLGRHSATSTTNGTLCFYVKANGNVVNATGSYTGISDIKLKENIVDANSQWDDLKALQIRNYNFKPETNQQTHTQIGLIAQEVELVSPGLVTESSDRDNDGNDLGTTTKSVNYSVLYMKAVKALQEAMERIETLEQRLSDAGID